MVRFLALFVTAVLIGAGCSSQKPATVKGTLQFEGKPFPLPADAREVFVAFHGLGSDGKIDKFTMYTAQIEKDGSFEVFASDGKLPAGTYQWSIAATKGAEQFKPFAIDKTKARIELKPGPNQVVLDLNSK